MDADTAMVRELVGRLVTALLAAHRWDAAPGHGTDRAAQAAARLVGLRAWNTECRHRVACRHQDDGAPGTCHTATTLERTRAGGAVLRLAGAWGGWGTNRPLGLCDAQEEQETRV